MKKTKIFLMFFVAVLTMSVLAMGFSPPVSSAKHYQVNQQKVEKSFYDVSSLTGESALLPAGGAISQSDIVVVTNVSSKKDAAANNFADPYIMTGGIHDPGDNTVVASNTTGNYCDGLLIELTGRALMPESTVAINNSNTQINQAIDNNTPDAYTTTDAGG
jgi:hypothetical protein